MWQVKTASGPNRKVEDIEALRALVVTGEVKEDSQVRKGTRGKWRLAADVPELIDCFATAADEEDPWAAWDDDLDELGEDVRDEVTSGHDDDTDEVPSSTIDIEDDDPSVEVPIDAIPTERPQLSGRKKPTVKRKKSKKKIKKPSKPPEVGDRKGPKFVVESKPTTDPEDAPTGPLPGRLPAPERGKVIDFPEGGRRRTRPLQTSAQPAYSERAQAEARRRPEPNPLDSVQTRYLGYLYFIMVACLGVGIGVWYIWSVATWSSQDPIGHSLGAEAPKTLTDDPVVELQPTALVEPVDEGDALQPTLDELKAAMVHDVVDIPPHDITPWEDELFLEFMKLVSVKEQDIQVLTWDEDGMPEQVAFTIEVRSQGDPMRELGAVALVLGKYIDHYELLVRGFEVVRVDEDAGTAGSYTIDPDRAVRLYRDEIGLIEALSEED